MSGFFFRVSSCHLFVGMVLFGGERGGGFFFLFLFFYLFWGNDFNGYLLNGWNLGYKIV